MFVWFFFRTAVPSSTPGLHAHISLMIHVGWTAMQVLLGPTAYALTAGTVPLTDD